MNVVITGSTKGIGFGLAREFLKRGHAVMVSSRSAEAVDSAMDRLSREFPQGQIAGHPCDVTEYAQVASLFQSAVNAFGRVEVWINNAGRDSSKLPFPMLEPADFRATIETNLLGLMNGTHACIAGMQAQGGGWIWNMEGLGSNGQIRKSSAPYGATKRALRYFTRAMVKELEDAPIKVGYLSPGIVVTDLLVPPPELRGEGWERSKKILNILADRVETVTPFLVEGILAARKSGTAVRWLTPRRIWGRFLKSPFSGRRDLFTPLGY